jgi:uncharacterized membrane protein YuzA (DUF378 family)
MSKVYDTETLDADPAPTREYDLAPVTFGTDTFRNPFFWILVGVAGTMAIQYIMTRKKE